MWPVPEVRDLLPEDLQACKDIRQAARVHVAECPAR